MSRGFGRKLWRRYTDYDIDALPWGSIPVDRYPPEMVTMARYGWTENAFNEYTTAAAMGALVTELLKVRAPIEMVGLASQFAAEEIIHVELCARVAMELGGGGDFEVDPDTFVPALSKKLTPMQRASELMVILCCVGEAISFPLLGGSLRAAALPLTKAVLEKIVQDEAHHGRLGYLFLDWAESALDDKERKRLGRVAERAIATYLPLWRGRIPDRDGKTAEGFAVEHVHELGWMAISEYTAVAESALRESIVEPLAERGIPVRLTPGAV
jgi:hypothetical protein